MLPTFAQSLAKTLTESASISLVDQIQAKAIQTSLLPKAITTTYIQSGRNTQAKSENMPILLIHGFDSSLIEFRRLFPLLAPHHETWAIDLLGFGLTDRPQGIEFNATNIKQHLYNAWQTFIDHPVILVGASMGGTAAIDFCLTYPEAVSKLVLLDSAGMTQTPDMGKFMVPPLGWIAAEFLRNRRVRQSISRAAYFDKSLASLDALACSMLHVGDPNWRRSLISFTRSGGYTFFSRNLVEKISCPTLILWGRNDEILGTKDAETFGQAIADSKFVWCDRCGHVPHLEQPEETARQILDFSLWRS
ncbi:MAG: alpha/beta hydrolase [Cyanobacteria bacterium P01_F01_bin.150]